MEPRDVRQVGVVGCGLMGSGHRGGRGARGRRVTFVEGSRDLVDAGRARVEHSVGKAVERGKLDGADAAAAAAAGPRRHRPHGARRRRPRDRGGHRATRGEAAGSSRTLGEVTRAERGARLQHVVDPDRRARDRQRAARAAWWGCTSSTRRPVMALLELTPAVTTSDETLAFVRAYGTDVLGKTCVRGEGRGRVHREPAPDPVPLRRDPPLRARASPRARTSTPRSTWASPIRWARSRSRTSSASTPRCCVGEVLLRGVRRTAVRAAAAAAPDGGGGAPGPQDRPRLLRLRLS